MNRWMLSLLAGVTVLLGLAGCREDGPLPTPATDTPDAVAAAAAPEVEFELSYPADISWGDLFGITVTNTGSAALELYLPEGDNCLFVQSTEQSLALQPQLTCDVISVQIVGPGESVRYGSWDLLACADPICAARVPAPAGSYFVDVAARPAGTEAEQQVSRAEFSLIGEAPAAAQTPRSPAGELVWLLTADLGTEQSFSGELAPDVSEAIFVHMSGLGQESPNASSRQVMLTLACDGPGPIEWFHEHFAGEAGYPVRSAILGCGNSDTVYFSFETNSQTIRLQLPAGAGAPVRFTLTAAIHSPA